MSTAEIQDNKWEVSAAKPELFNASGLGLMLMMAGFVGYFVWMTIFSVVGAFTDGKVMDFDKKQKVDADGKAIQGPAE
jgi:hypothetical protein